MFEIGDIIVVKYRTYTYLGIVCGPEAGDVHVTTPVFVWSPIMGCWVRDSYPAWRMEKVATLYDLGTNCEDFIYSMNRVG